MIESIAPRRNVLVVEDDAAALAMYEAALRMDGFHVRTAADGLSALRQLETFTPDVMILDLWLPIATGFEVLHELRTARTLRLLPVIAVSGHAHGLELARRNPDFFAALQKPFDPADLIETTRLAIRDSQRRH